MAFVTFRMMRWAAAVLLVAGCAGSGEDRQVEWGPGTATVELVSNHDTLAPGDVAVVTVRLRGVPAEAGTCVREHAQDFTLVASPVETGQVDVVNARGELAQDEVPITWSSVSEELRDGALYFHAEGTVVVQARQDGLVTLAVRRNEHVAALPLVAARAGQDALVLRIACTPAFDVSGTYARRIACSERRAGVAAETCALSDRVSTLTLRKTGVDPAEYSFEDRSGHVIEVGRGRLCGKVFTWNAQQEGAGGHFETGVWSFSDARAFVQTRSSYQRTSGEALGRCTGAAALGGLPPPPAPVGACP